MFAFNIVMLPLLDSLIGLYDLSAETVIMAKDILILHGINCCITWPMAFNTPNAFRACADVKYTLFVSAGSMWIVRIGLSFVFGKYMGMGVYGVWLAMVLDWVARFIFFAARYKGHKWEKASLVA